MSVAEKVRQARPLSDMEQALLTVLNENAAATELVVEENNALRANDLADRLVLQVLRDGLRDAREQIALELPDVVPFVQEHIDTLARLEQVCRSALSNRTVAGVRRSVQSHVETPLVAARGSESEAGVEESIGGVSRLDTGAGERVREHLPAIVAGGR